jgi:hypothetical protein
MYRLYGQNKQTGWEQIDTKKEFKDINKIAEKLTGKEYYSYVIIQNNGNGDEVIGRKDFTRECTVEYVDEVKTKFEVKATTFKPSRMKRKQEERKMFEQYIDR